MENENQVSNDFDAIPTEQLDNFYINEEEAPAPPTPLEEEQDSEVDIEEESEETELEEETDPEATEEEDPELEEEESDEETEEETEEEDQELFTVKANGEEIQVTLDELLNGYSRQADYTREKQALKAEYEPYMNLANTLTEHPQLAEKVKEAYSNYFSGEENGAAESEDENLFDEDYNFDISKDPRFKAMEERIQKFERQQAEQDALKEWNALTGKYPDAMDMMDEIIDLADSKGYDLETAYRFKAFENKDKIVKQTEQKIVRQNMKKKITRTQSPSNAKGAKGGTIKSPTPKSYDDVWTLIQQNGINLTD